MGKYCISFISKIIYTPSLPIPALLTPRSSFLPLSPHFPRSMEHPDSDNEVHEYDIGNLACDDNDGDTENDSDDYDSADYDYLDESDHADDVESDYRESDESDAEDESDIDSDKSTLEEVGESTKTNAQISSETNAGTFE